MSYTVEKMRLQWNNVTAINRTQESQRLRRKVMHNILIIPGTPINLGEILKTFSEVNRIIRLLFRAVGKKEGFYRYSFLAWLQNKPREKPKKIGWDWK
jgi:hypothetical protein